MRPIKLILSAFGSYAEKQEILFDAKRERLFLITGDTGAGKTTIFDAICFALYGEMSGDIREGRMMRSDFALPDQRTYVEFIFEDKGKLYKIVRNPEYYRQSKRKKKTEDGSFSYRFTKETAKAELFFLNGTIEEGQIAQGINQLEERAFTGTIREVNAKLVEILGLDQRQFTQIAMLAQGEFMKLLVAPTDQKKEIFQRLFHTKKYYQIVKLMGEKKKVKEVYLEKLRTECEIILQETDCAKESKYRMEFHTYKSAYFLHPKKFLQSLETVIKEEEETISIAKQELACLKEQRDTLLLEIHQIEQKQLLFSKLTQAKKKKEQWEKEEKEIKKKEDILEKAERADYVEGKKIIFDEVEKKKEKQMVQIEHKKKEREETKGESEKNKEAFVLIEKEKNENEERLKQEIAELEKNLPKYDEIEEIKKEKKQQEKKQNMLKKSIEELEIEIQRQEVKILKLEQRQLEIEDFIKELPEKKLLLSKVKEELTGYQELKKEVEKIPELLNKKEESQKIFVKAEKEFKEKSHLYEDLVIRFTNGQAGLMAEKLRNGENLPCPVCGNTSYVLLAPLEKEIPTQEQVKRAKKKRDDLEQEMLHTSELAGTEKEAYEKQVLLCKEKCRQLTNGMIEFSMDDGNVLEIEHKILILEKKKKELEVEKRTLEKFEKEIEDQRKEIKETKEEIEHLDSISSALDIALNEEDLVQIKAELTEYGYIKKHGNDPKGNKKKKPASKPLHFLSSDGFHMYVGKNNFQNEELTFKLASGNDWWFHAKGIAGSHVIVKSEGKEELPDRVFEEAGALAAFYSKGRDMDKVDVDYIQKKHIKKPNSQKPGFVIYHTKYSLTIAPDIKNLKPLED